MKIMTLVLLVSNLCFAATKPACLGEARIIAQVESTQTDSLTDCNVKINVSSITHYSVNRLCPLDLNEVLEKSVSVGLVNGHDCALLSGDQISGVIVKKPWGQLVLE